MNHFVKSLFTPLATVATVPLLIALISLLLFRFAGPPPYQIYPAAATEVKNSVVNAGERAAGISDAKKKNPALQVGILLGQSGAQHAILPSILNSQTKTEHRWISLFARGGGMQLTRWMSQTMALVELHPDVVVLCIHPIMLQPRPPAGETSKSPIAWPYEDRLLINKAIEETLLHLRLKWLRWAGAGPNSFFKSNPHPLDVPPYRHKAGWPNAVKQMNYYRAHGWLDAKQYSESKAQAEDLRRMIGDIRASGSRVFVVFLPESSALRHVFPMEGREFISQALSQAGVATSDIISLVDSVPDEQFLDNTHVTLEGGNTASRILARRLSEQLSAVNPSWVN